MSGANKGGNRIDVQSTIYPTQKDELCRSLADSDIRYVTGNNAEPYPAR